MCHRCTSLAFLIFFSVSNSARSGVVVKPIILKPILEYSFCTPSSSGGTIALVGEGWALELWFQCNELNGNIKSTNAHFHRGPNMNNYIGRSAGPRRPPPPATEDYSMVKLSEVSININRTNTPKAGWGKLSVTKEVFRLLRVKLTRCP